MKNATKKIFFFLFLLSFCSCYRKYVPLVFDGNQIIEAPKLFSHEHQKNLIQVLDYYGKSWKLENDSIYVSSGIDDDTMWNFTTKANDTVWLRTHKVK